MKLNINCNYDPITEIHEDFQKNGLICPTDIATDGQIHRFRANWSKKEDNDSGWYVFFESDDIVSGCYGDWSRDLHFKFHSDSYKELSKEEKESREQKIREAAETAKKEREAQQEVVSTTCAAIWNNLPEATTQNGYIARKCLHNTYGAKAQGDLLVLPLVDKNGKIWSLQTISTDGTKIYHKGGRVKGLFYVIGRGEPEYLCEGFATAVSVHEATGKVVVMAFSAGNLSNVAKQFPNLTVVADNDESKTGEIEAIKTKLPYVLIPEYKMDANDYALKYGLSELAKVLGKKISRFGLVDGSEWLIQPKPKEWLIKNYLLKGKNLTMIFGKSGNGKTFIVIEMMMSLVCGFGAFPGLNGKKRNVLFLCGEGEDSNRERMAAWFQAHGASAEDIKQHLKIIPVSTTLDKKENLEAIMAELDRAKFVPDIIFIDTLARYLGGDENDTKEANDFTRACNTLMDHYLCGIVLVHHTGQGEDTQKRERGSSVFRGALDMQLRVDKSGDRITLVNTKNKGGKELEGLTFKLVDRVLEGFFEEDGSSISCPVLELVGNTTEEKAPRGKSKQQVKDENMIIHAFIERGTMVVNKPWISKENLIDYLAIQMDSTRDAARKAVTIRNTSYKDKPRLMERLMSYGDIEIVYSGKDITGFYCNEIMEDGVAQPHITMRTLADTKRTP